MARMPYLAIVTVLALIEFLAFGILVGRARGKYGIAAPATSGHPIFERTFRVHQNTQEQLLIHLPALWLFGQLISPVWGAVLGLVFIAGRAIYAAGYIADPEKRGAGFLIGGLANLALLLGALYGAIARLVTA
jgi:glutathione S-transferase